MIRSLNELIYLVGETIVGAIFILAIASVWAFIHDQIEVRKMEKWDKQRKEREEQERKEKEKKSNYKKGVYDYEIKIPSETTGETSIISRFNETEEVDKIIFENLFEEEKEKFNKFLDLFLRNKSSKIENMINNFIDKKNIIYFKVARYKTPEFNHKNINNKGLARFYYASLFAGLNIELEKEFKDFTIKKTGMYVKDETLREEYIITDITKLEKYDYLKTYKLTICVILDPKEETMILKLEII